MAWGPHVSFFSLSPLFFSLTPPLSSPRLPTLALAPLEGGGVLQRPRPSSSGRECSNGGGRAAQEGGLLTANRAQGGRRVAGY
jgi:hypothetical protein